MPGAKAKGIKQPASTLFLPAIAIGNIDPIQPITPERLSSRPGIFTGSLAAICSLQEDRAKGEKHMTRLTLAAANDIVTGAFAKAGALGLKPLSVAVLDAGGHLVAFQKQDGSSMLRFEIASGKAYGALSLGMGSRQVETTAKERPHFMAGLSGVSGGKIVPVPGGVLIRDKDRQIIGAVGISGDTSDNDEAAAVAGIEGAGLQADGG